MIVPDAIHHHARGQRILRVGKPLRQRGAAAGGFDVRRRHDLRRRRIEQRQEAGLHFFFRGVVHAHARMWVAGALRPRSAIPDALGQFAGIDAVELRQLGFQRVVLLLGFAAKLLWRHPRRPFPDTVWPWRTSAIRRDCARPPASGSSPEFRAGTYRSTPWPRSCLAGSSRAAILARMSAGLLFPDGAACGDTRRVGPAAASGCGRRRRCWRRRPAGGNSRPAGWGRTCDCGSVRIRKSGPGRRRRWRR